MSLPRALTDAGLSDIPGLAHGFFTRQGGISPAPYGDLNASTATGDSPANVASNLARVKAALGLERLATVYQVHGRKVIAVDGRLPVDELTPLAEADGLMTDRPGVGLLIKTADCLAVLAADPVRQVAGAVHAGWRGLVEGAVPALIEAMTHTYGCRPADIRAAVGPSLGPCCAEFVNYRTEFPASMWPYGREDNHFDLWAVARDQLTAAGLRPDRVTGVEQCTRCRGDLFFSHRGQGPTTGRLAAVIGWTTRIFHEKGR